MFEKIFKAEEVTEADDPVCVGRFRGRATVDTNEGSSSEFESRELMTDSTEEAGLRETAVSSGVIAEDER